jgi:hypothetical protein
MTSTVLVQAIATITSASNFSAARDRGFAASWCYAKITPAALRRRDFGGAAANMPKLLDRCRNPSSATLFALSRTERRRARKGPEWHEVKQSVPDA